MSSSIKVSVGAVVVEFEGSEEYIREELPRLIELLGDLAEPPDVDLTEEESEVLPASSEPGKKKLEMTTNTIASKIGASSGSDLVLAACAHLSFVKGQESFKRANILGEMQLATNYYKKSYSSNLSKYLRGLVKSDKILEVQTDTYALEASEKQRLERELIRA